MIYDNRSNRWNCSRKELCSQCFKEFGAALFDADSVVHQLYKVDKNIISYAEEKFPGVVVNGKIDRTVLSKYFLAHDENWKQFQSLVHSAVQNELEFFIAHEKENNRKLLVLDIPLLLKRDSICIAILLFLSMQIALCKLKGLVSVIWIKKSWI